GGGLAVLRKKRQGQQPVRQCLGGGDAVLRRQAAAAFAQCLAQRGAVGRRAHAGADRAAERRSLRRGDACETTLNPGFKWERSAAIGLSARGGLALPATVAPPWSSLRDKANVAHAVAHSRGRAQYSPPGAGWKRPQAPRFSFAAARPACGWL